MKQLSGPRKSANLSESFQQQLNAYALAAGAAGVSLLALVQPSEAKIVYRHLDLKIPYNSRFGLDLNHDQIFDFRFSNSFFTSSFSASARFGVVGLRKNQVIVSTGGCASGLAPGKRVGPGEHFGKPSFRYLMAQLVSHHTNSTTQTKCPWSNQKAAFLGLKFLFKGKIHFGWARLKMTFDKPVINALFIDYAYETIPNKAILAGHTHELEHSGIEEPNGYLTTPPPAVLGTLALGARGLATWREK
jgi:hypothetical protein